MYSAIYSPDHTQRLRLEIDLDPENPREWSNLGTMVCRHRRYLLGDQQEGLDDLMHALDDDWQRFGADLRDCPGTWSLNPEESEPELLEVAERYGLTADEYGEVANPYDPDTGDPGQVFESIELLERLAGKSLVYWMPLYLYDHSGITMSTGPFACPWDSGQVGIIYVTRRKAEQEMPRWDGEDESDWEQRVCQALRSEVAVYDQYLTGDVYGFVLESLDREQVETGEAPEDFADEPSVWDDGDSCWGFFGDDLRTNGMLDHLDDQVKRWVSASL